MNKANRKELQLISDRLDRTIILFEECCEALDGDLCDVIGEARKAAAANDDLSSVSEDIDNVREVEQEKFDNLPETLQNAENGEAMQQAIENLEWARDELDNLIGGLVTDTLCDKYEANPKDYPTLANDLANDLSSVIDSLHEVSSYLSEAAQ